MTELKTRIKELRLENGLTLKQLGDKIGIRDNTLSQYENDKRTVPYEVLVNIGLYFGCSIDYLLKKNDTKDEMKFNRIKQLREKNGLSQKELAEKIDVPITTIELYETAQYFPRVDVWKKMASLFKMSVPYLKGLIAPTSIDRFTKNRVKELRIKKNISIEALSKATSISVDVLKEYENNESAPKGSNLRNLSLFFEVTPAYLKEFTIYPNGKEISNDIEKLKNNTEKQDFIKRLKSFERNMLIDENITGNTVGDLNDLIISTVSVAQQRDDENHKRLEKMRELEQSLYGQTQTKLLQRNDDIDEDEDFRITYKNEFDLVYYLNLVLDNLSVINLDKVDNAIAALQDLIGSNDVTVSDDLKKFIDSYKSN